MSEKSDGIRQAGGRIDTLIGADVRIDGRIAFRGVLRTEGRVFGDIAGTEGAAGGTVVVGRSGSVVGTIDAGSVIVGGRVEGDLHAGESAEVLKGAQVVGDVRYGRIRVAAGGTVEGALMPSGGMAAGESGDAAAEMAMPRQAVPTEAGSAIRRKWWGVAIAVLLAGAGVLVMSPKGHQPTDPATLAEMPGPEAAVPAEPRAPAPEPVKAQLATPAAPAHDVPASAAATTPVVAMPAQTSPPAADRVTIVPGDEADKSPDFVFVVANRASVLGKKKRDQVGDGTRIDLGAGASKRIAVGADDVLRVTEGQDVDIFYQGHKVSPATIRSGAWLRFAPYGSER